MGFVTEAMAPMFPNFPYHHKDLMFMGKWVDYIVFDGMHEWDIKQIVFVEVKTGKSRLNANEKRIQKAIDAKRVKYEVWRV
jgi:predicted Holliday junction resolvase-like endonuclease